MNTKNNDKKGRKKFLFFLCLMIAIPLIGILIWRLEGDAPTISIDMPSPEVGLTKNITIHFADKGSGLRKIWVGLIKDGAEIVLDQKTYPSKDLIRGGLVNNDPCVVKIEPRKLNLTDGEAILRVVAYDYSWRKWLQGNQAYTQKDIVIDTKPPKIDLYSRIHNISQGGSALVIYRIPEKNCRSGVMVGDNYFPGHPGYFKDPQICLAFFALSYEQGPGTEVYLTATDKAGNQARAGFSHYLKRKKFRDDRINISDNFLKWKMPEFQIDQGAGATLVDQFLYVNREIRMKNGQTLVQPGPATAHEIFWQGPFLRLPNSANRAQFADHRVYYYKNKEIDRQVHLGIDLASVAQSPVPAANTGVVKIADLIGIYGKTIVIDHGFGLFSTYSHLSQMDVQVGQKVKKGEVIGRTGITGLAGGDHLHYGMFIHNTFVNPVEWWDASWIKNNITNKLENLQKR